MKAIRIFGARSVFSRLWPAALLLVPALSDSVSASPRIGIFALVDRVVLEPHPENPERIQVWGAFAIADPANGSYREAKRGYLYLAMDQKQQQACLKEWRDLSRLAGSGDCLAFGRQQESMPEVRAAVKKPEKPEVYPVAFGIRELKGASSRFEPLRQVRALPRPLAPAPGSEAAPGTVQLGVENVSSEHCPGARYHFQIQGPLGAEESSPALPAGEKTTTWSPKLEIRAGEKYRWKVWIVVEDWRAPAVESEFTGKAKDPGGAGDGESQSETKSKKSRSE